MSGYCLQGRNNNSSKKARAYTYFFPKNKNKKVENEKVQKPRSLSETLAGLDSFLYPTIGRMLLTFLTMSVSTAASKRSYSAMRRIKT